MIRTLVILLLTATFVSGFAGLAAYRFEQPAGWPKPQYDFDKNPLSANKIRLGRILFYDPILSRDSSTSCASCHSPFNAFAHTDHDLSHGIDDQIGTRNAPPLFNMAWQSLFMWDGAINHLDMQALAPISHPKEMGESIENLSKKLAASTRYRALFQNAFGDSTVSGERILKALSQFQLTLVSYNSKYDSVMRKESSFNAQELQGYELFKQHCSSCHREPLFSNFDFANNGLSVDSTRNDYGRMKITQNAKDSLKFKISLDEGIKDSIITFSLVRNTNSKPGFIVLIVCLSVCLYLICFYILIVKKNKGVNSE
jgi:cytochrome c peroxidase